MSIWGKKKIKKKREEKGEKERKRKGERGGFQGSKSHFKHYHDESSFISRRAQHFLVFVVFKYTRRLPLSSFSCLGRNRSTISATRNVSMAEFTGYT